MSLLRGVVSEVEVQGVAGPSSYPSGGFTQGSDMGRVDQFMVQVDNPDVYARPHSAGTSSAITGSNQMVIQVYSANTGNSAGTEASANSDFTNDNFVIRAFRL